MIIHYSCGQQKQKKHRTVKIRALALSLSTLLATFYGYVYCIIHARDLSSATWWFSSFLTTQYNVRLSNVTKYLSVSTIQSQSLVYNNSNMSIMFSMSILGHLRALYTSTQCGLAEFNLVTGVLQIWSSPDKSVPPSILEYIHTHKLRFVVYRFRRAREKTMNMPGQVD